MRPKLSSRIETFAPPDHAELGDFTTTRRLVPISMLAIGIGCFGAVLALALLRLIALFTNLFYFHRWSFAASSPADHHLGYSAVILPAIGALVIGVMARYGSERIRGHGIPEAIESILLRGSRVEPRVAILKPLSSAISIGSGGPFGAEGPIIMTAGAMGSIVARFFHLTSAERKTLLVAGAAAGMSATFASPVAASLLAVELLLFEWKPRSFVPVALASATAAALRPLLLGAGPVFVVPHHVPVASAFGFAACALVGIAAGVLSGVLTKAVYLFEDLFPKLRVHWMWWPAIGGLVVGIGGLVEPRALGVGYETIEAILRDELTIKVLVVLVLVKGTIWSVSLGSGTSGGVLAPLLMMGAALGGVVGHVLPDQGAGFWPLVSMAAILGGTMRSPFTGIVFAVELTHDLEMLLPLLIAVAIAHAFTVLVLKRSILTEKISRRGFHLSREYATDPLEILFVREVMSERIPEAPPAPTGEDFLEACCRPDESLRVVVHRMAERGLAELPVVDPAQPTAVLGWITLHALMKARVRHLEEERRREGALPLRPTVPRWLKKRVGA